MATDSQGGKKHMRWQRAPQRSHVTQSRESSSPQATHGSLVRVRLRVRVRVRVRVRARVRVRINPS